MKKMILTGLTAAVLSANAMASEVTEGDVTQFNANTPALASEVNGNFAALVSAINDNNERISALEDAAGTGGSLEDKIAGSTYKVMFVGNIIGTHHDALSPHSSGYLEGFGGTSVITFNEDGSLSEQWQEAGREIGLDKDDCEETQPDTFVCEHRVDDFVDGPETFTNQGSWSLDGNVLAVTFPEEEDSEDFLVSMNGELIILTSSSIEQESDEYGTNSDYEHSIAIGVRLPVVE
ncbi:hypothetical protein Q670_14570 [Alcanivorax sp. P2S70]|uniref:hypothetical protein n=1 Tax=Alcanivorax sp. P2S70 TaxID=1397527 RepID=UPI0003B4A6ED|nr:hypothetical protein [Alcanivorax sp. P2S70]ERP90119.1 hypothetical protein Q670_14570 [Alcanivorax sp. P2S70]